VSKSNQFFYAHTLPVAAVRSSSDDRRGPVLRITSCFHIVGPVGQNQTWRCVSLNSPDSGTGSKVASTIASFLYILIVFVGSHRCQERVNKE